MLVTGTLLLVLPRVLDVLDVLGLVGPLGLRRGLVDEGVDTARVVEPTCGFNVVVVVVMGVVVVVVDELRTQMSRPPTGRQTSRNPPTSRCSPTRLH